MDDQLLYDQLRRRLAQGLTGVVPGIVEPDEFDTIVSTVMNVVWPEIENYRKWIGNLEKDRLEQLDLLGLLTTPDPVIFHLGQSTQRCEYCEVEVPDTQEFVHLDTCPWLRARRIVSG